MKSTILNLFKEDYTSLSPDNIALHKRLWASRTGSFVKDSDILAIYKHLVKEGDIEPNINLENSLQTRSIRTRSGVTPFAVMTKPYICPGQCTFCPLELGMPKSYLSDEPAAQRAKKFNFDPRLQIENRLDQLVATGHNTDKIELIVIGGTFSNYPSEYKIEFFKGMIDAVNGTDSSSLEEAQKINKSAPRRIVGISIETRPDWLDAEEVRLLRYLGVTKLQVGVQAFDEEILKKIRRGHSLDAVAESTRRLKNAGFKICYHFMPNLPGSTPAKDLEMASLMYEDERFKPDFVKIYPAQVIPHTELHREWERGEFETYPDEVMLELLTNIKLITPRSVRIDRLVRDISKKWVSSGTHKTNMRQIIQHNLEKEGKSCECIRCREVKDRAFGGNPSLVTAKIDTLGGTEYMLTFEEGDSLYSLLRLRLPSQSAEILFPELTGSAIIREIHTYGTAVPIDEESGTESQHKGLGKKLIREAESLAKESGYSKISVISSMGTKGYYEKLGYKEDGLYMSKMF